MNVLATKYKVLIEEAADKLKPFPYCSSKHFKDYVILEILQRAIAEVINRPKILKES